MDELVDMQEINLGTDTPIEVFKKLLERTLSDQPDPQYLVNNLISLGEAAKLSAALHDFTTERMLRATRQFSVRMAADVWNDELGFFEPESTSSPLWQRVLFYYAVTHERYNRLGRTR